MRRPRLAAVLFVLALCVLAGPALAVLPSEMLPDPALEARARALSKEVRCQVCQNQNIDDSAAPLAADLRRLIRERLTAGDSDAQILDYLVKRYGEYILMRPPMEPATWPLWFGPAALLVAAAISLAVIRRRRADPPPDLAPEEEERVRAIVERRP
ncbi:MAG TPA: cytochrome c-type biogenesis protein [Alphaproteobacteria bacterium]